MEASIKKRPKAWIISVNMGYGHQRTAFPLRFLAPEGKVINANDYKGIPVRDRRIWKGTSKFYEMISNFKSFYLIGEFFFSFFNRFQKIISFYPKKDSSDPSFQLKQIEKLIKTGWGAHLIDKLTFTKGNKYLPLISTFFTPAFMAEFLNYPGDIYCVICDADIARPWASMRPSESRIKYFAPNKRVVERLKLYGVKEKNIFLTGYPLPLENISSNPTFGELDILKNDLRYRLINLDPKETYRHQYNPLIRRYLTSLPFQPNHPLTLMFSVGGAGAQKEIAFKVVVALKNKLKENKIRIILAVGIKEKVKYYFINNLNELGFNDQLGRNIELISARDIETYFEKFNLALRKTDILWTKPSELSFYAALGIPIIIAPPIGSQEDFNLRWLEKSGFGIRQEDPNYTDQWLFDWLNQGYLAEAAMQCFIEGDKLGTYNIEEIISK